MNNVLVVINENGDRYIHEPIRNFAIAEEGTAAIPSPAPQQIKQQSDIPSLDTTATLH